MKPLNLDNSPCSPISSNCVIWQGPDIPCIKLCTGDTITVVVYALALQLCNIVDQVNISTLNLSCLNITTGTPTNINDLLQILINKICELNNVQVPSGRTITDSCPTNCIVNVAECLRTGSQTTMKLLDYVQLIGNELCSIITQINSINSSISNLTTRVEELESIPPTPAYILPSFIIECTLAESSVEAGNSYQLDVILDALVNDNDHGYCALLGTLGQPSVVATARDSQTVDGTDGALSNCSLTLDQLFSTTWITTPQNLSESFIDLWLVVKDIRDAYKRYNVTAGNSNVTVTTTTTPGTCGPEVSFAVKANSASVIAGTNTTVTSVVTTGDNTEYTVNAKNASVIAGDNITVTADTTDPLNTIYTVNNEGLDSVVLASVINSNRKPNIVSTNPSNTITDTIPIRTPGIGVAIGGDDMDILVRYNYVTINNVNTDAGLTAGAYIPNTTLPFGTYTADTGIVTINQSGTYEIVGTLQLKSANSTIPIWQISGIGSFQLGILSSSNNVFTGNSQSLQGPITLATGSTPTTIPGIHTTVSLTASTVAQLNSGDVVRLGVFNFSDRAYSGTDYTSGDIIRFAITRLR